MENKVCYTIFMKKTLSRIITLVVLAAILTTVYYAMHKGEIKNYTIYPASSDATFYTIQELNQEPVQPGTYNTEGFAVKLYDCPPCPRGAVCKPCMGSNIVLSENKLPIETYNQLTSDELIVFVDRAEQFEIGSKYLMTIQVLERNSTGNPNGLNDVELVGFTILTP